MTWMTGTTPLGTLDTVLTQLICGEIAAGNGNTNSTPWLREVTRTTGLTISLSGTAMTDSANGFTTSDVGCLVIHPDVPLGTTIASYTSAGAVTLSAAATTASGISVQICTNSIRTPASQDVASGNCSNRTGYFRALGDGNVGFNSTVNTFGCPTVCKVTGPFTSDPSVSGFHRWVVRINILTANSAANNYSTAQIQVLIFDADVPNSGYLGNNVYAPNSSGVVTVSNGLQITLSDPSGFLVQGVQFIRGFTSTYMYGIDQWPFFSRSHGNPTIAVAPPGTAGTDYDILTGQISNMTGTIVSQGLRADYFSGLGIKTATGLGSGNLYTVSFPMALGKCRIFNGTSLGLLGLDVGASAIDHVNGNVPRTSGIRVTNWAKFIQTPASASTSTSVQYWMSVTATGIALALNADPGGTGKMTTAFYGAFTPYDTVHDVFPMMFSVQDYDYTTSAVGSQAYMGVQYLHDALVQRQNGSEGSRDWQTKWFNSGGVGSGSSGVGYGGGFYSDIVNTTSVSALQQHFFSPARQTKPSPIDGNWWLYPPILAEGTYFESDPIAGITGNSYTVDYYRHIRGSVPDRFFYLPEDGFGQGDELTDTNTSIKYLLVKPDYAGGFGYRQRENTPTNWGYVAIAEL